MNYRHPELRNALAAEYVLGTLRGAARRRFEQLLHEDFKLREAVQNWQNDLYPALLDALPEQAPPERVWQTIQRNSHTRVIRPVATSPSWSPLNFWRLWGTVAMMLLITVLGFIGAGQLQLLPHSQPDLIAVLENQTSDPAWLIEIDRDQRSLHITTLEPQPLAPDRRFDFWLVPPTPGSDPILLGQLPARDQHELSLPRNAAQILDQGIVLAVTVEPLTGTLDGSSVGPVLYQGRIISP